MTSSPAPADIHHFIPPGLGRPFVIGHRGASAQAPENTLAAFRLAWDSGADAVELDVRRTADGELIVLHDSRLDRTTDIRGRAAQLAFAQVERARCRPVGGISDQRVPTLDEVLQQIPAGKRCLIEVKERGTALQVLDRIRTARVLESVGVCSFIASELRVLRATEPVLPLVLNLPPLPWLWLSGRVKSAARIGATGIFVFPSRLGRSLVRRARDLRLEVHAGPVDTPEAARAVVEAGVDAIETNDPMTILTVLPAVTKPVPAHHVSS